MTSEKPLLQIRNLSKYFPIKSKGLFQKTIGHVKATDDISFDLKRNEILGIVGESGCGKTTTARSILQALEPTSGTVTFRGGGVESELTTLPPKELRAMRQHMQMIFQDPFASLNPRMTVGGIISEPLIIHKLVKGKALRDKVDEIIEKVGLNPEHKGRYPHAFSGGQRQRIGIARALIMEPEFVVADEAVSALDVSVQAQIINLLDDLRKEMSLSMIFVAHDLSVVRHICDRVAVMYAGRIVELADTKELFTNPKHPYTQALLSAIPDINPDIPMKSDLKGEVADPGNLPPGCSFNPRCRKVCDECKQSVPELEEIGTNHLAACGKLG